VLWFFTTTVLIFASVILTRWFSRASIPDLGKVEVHTERDKTGKDSLFAIRDKATKELLWAQLLGEAGEPASLVSFYQGKPVFEIHITSIAGGETNTTPKRDVLYYDDVGKLKLILGDRRGDGLLTERIFYGEGKPRMEVWYNCQWTPVEDRDGKRGLLVDGKWSRLTITNGAWEPIAN
jgi:hypothetical protein